MAGRWAKLYEKITEWEWYKDGNTARVFFHLLVKANYKDTSWNKVAVRRGQLVTSLPSLASELGLTVQNVRTALEHLESTGEISQFITKNYRLVTVNNYTTYQGDVDEAESGSQTAAEPQTNQQTNHKQINRPKAQHSKPKQQITTNASTDKSTDEVTADIESLESKHIYPPYSPPIDNKTPDPPEPLQPDPIHEEIFAWLGGVPPLATEDIADLRASPGIDDELIREAIKSTKARGIRQWEYAAKIIRNAVSRGLITGEQFRAAKEVKTNGRKYEVDERYTRSPGTAKRTGAFIEKPGVDWDSIIPEA